MQEYSRNFLALLIQCIPTHRADFGNVWSFSIHVFAQESLERRSVANTLQATNTRIIPAIVTVSPGTPLVIQGRKRRLDVAHRIAGHSRWLLPVARAWQRMRSVSSRGYGCCYRVIRFAPVRPVRSSVCYCSSIERI